MTKRGSKAVSTLLAAALLVSLAGPGEWAAAAESSAAENSQVTQSAHGSEGAGGDGAGANAPKRRIAPPKQTPSNLKLPPPVRMRPGPAAPPARPCLLRMTGSVLPRKICRKPLSARHIRRRSPFTAVSRLMALRRKGFRTGSFWMLKTGR